jgi:nitroreductase
MTTFDTIKNRRSIGKMTDQRPSRQQIEHILEAATHAPNHHHVQPWRFIVLAGSVRAELGAVMAEALAARIAGNPSLEGKTQAMLDKERHKPLRSPVLIVAVAEHPRPEQLKVLEIENIEATAAAVQNLLLAAEEIGLAAMWRTGDAAFDPHVKQWLGIAPEDAIVAFVYLGYPAIPKLERHPIPFQQKTSWRGWEE